MRGSLIAVVATVVLAVTTAVAAPDYAAMRVERIEPSKPAPAFELPDLAGKTHRLAESARQGRHARVLGDMVT